LKPAQVTAQQAIQRFAGPSAAAKYGAVGAIVRSITPALDDYPHTGGTVYVDGLRKIPAAAISTLAANKLSSMLKAAQVAAYKILL
jgi:carboxypeptidase Q